MSPGCLHIRAFELGVFLVWVGVCALSTGGHISGYISYHISYVFGER